MRSLRKLWSIEVQILSRKLLLVVCCVPSISTVCWSADASDESIATKELLFVDDFERPNLGTQWKTVIPAFTVENGVLKGRQARDDHGAVGRVHRLMRDVIVEFKFQLAGSTTFNAVFDDQQYKGSHAGHICRVAFASSQIRLGDDKEGVMRNDIFEMRRDPQRREQADSLVVGKSSSAKISLQQENWYLARIEIVKDRMRVWLDGQSVGELVSSGLAHETKSSFHFTVSGDGVNFDDVKIWAIRD